MEDKSVKPLRPHLPLAHKLNTDLVAKQPLPEANPEAVINRLKPEVSNPEQASKLANTLLENISKSANQGLDAFKLNDLEHIKKLLEE